MLPSVTIAVNNIREKHYLMDKLFDIGRDFIKGEYHKKLGRYFKDRPSYLINASTSTLGLTFAYLTGHTELLFPSLQYSLASVLINAIGMFCDQFSTKYALKLNKEYESMTGKQYLMEREKRAIDEEGKLSLEKILPYNISSIVGATLVPILGLTSACARGIIALNNIRIARIVKEEIVYEQSRSREIIISNEEQKSI